MNITQESFELEKYLKREEEKQERGNVALKGEEPQDTSADGRSEKETLRYFIESSLSR